MSETRFDTRRGRVPYAFPTRSGTRRSRAPAAIAANRPQSTSVRDVILGGGTILSGARGGTHGYAFLTCQKHVRNVTCQEVGSGKTETETETEMEEKAEKGGDGEGGGGGGGGGEGGGVTCQESDMSGI